MTRRALVIPSSAICRSFTGREAARAISAREKKALIRMSRKRRNRLWLTLIEAACNTHEKWITAGE
ncbi:hypothetical protein D3C75_768170 [compost metagenome]